MSYSIIRFEKVKENLTLTAMAAHNFRFNTKTTRDENIDQSRSGKNVILKDAFGIKKAEDLQKKLHAHYKKLDVKVRQDSVLAIDFMLTTSPEFWGEWKLTLDTPETQAKIKDWSETQMAFMREKFGDAAIKTAVLHLDENTPHIHVLVTPEEEKEVTTKNTYGVYTKKKTVLNAKRWNPTFYEQLITDFAKANGKYGLERGKPKKNVKHKPLSEYKSLLASELNRQRRITNSYIRAIEDHDATKSLVKTLASENQELKREVLRLKAQKHEALTPDQLNELGL